MAETRRLAELDETGRLKAAQVPADMPTSADITASVNAAVDALVDGAPGALDTLRELADAIGDDADFAGTVTAALGARLEKAQNLADVADVETARANLDVYSTAEVDAAVENATYAPADSTPTIEELCVTFGPFSASSTRSWNVFVAPFDCKIESASLAVTIAVPASDTDYWDVQLRRMIGSNAIASKSTEATGGEGITSPHTDWNFDAAVWDETNRLFAKGDVLNIATFKTGAPANLTDVCLTVRYKPV